MSRRPFAGFGFAFAIVVAAFAWPSAKSQFSDTLPSRLSDAEFWALSESLSEPGGYFRSDNLVSNELYFHEVLPDLVSRVKPGGVYLGVGPEQNFHYIAAILPKMVFITDVRRGNLHTQLMYKALFELSADRAEFLSRLFTKPRPAGVRTIASAADLLEAYWTVETGPQVEFDANFATIIELLTKTHAMPLSVEDVEGIKYVYHSFYWFGPSITYNSTGNTTGRGGNMATFADLMRASDATGAAVSFLASEERFRFLKDLEGRNMVVPVVGNFAGPKALRAIGGYVREHGAAVGAFYLSNVEQYLRQDGLWGIFCSNVSSMPLTVGSTFIRSQSGGGGGSGGFRNSLWPIQTEMVGCTTADR